MKQKFMVGVAGLAVFGLALSSCSKSSDPGSIVDNDPSNTTCMEFQPDLVQAIRFGELACLKKAIEAGARVNDPIHESPFSEPVQPLIFALDSGSVFFAKNSPKIVRALIEAGANPNVKDASGEPAIHLALSGDSDKFLEVAKYLATVPGLDLNLRAPDGATPLVHSIQVKMSPVSMTLISRGADLNAKVAGQTALHTAIGQKLEEVASALIDAKADLAATDNSGNTALHLALRSMPAVSSKLIHAGAPVNAANAAGDMPLHVAISSKDVANAKLLISRGAPLEAKDGSGNEPLHLACSSDMLEVADLLLEKGVDPNAAGEAGQTAMHRAASLSNRTLVDHLIRKGGNPRIANNAGETPLHLTSDVELAKALVAAGADVKAGKQPPILNAVSGRNAAMVRYLISAGADPQWKDAGRESLLHKAIAGDSLDVATALLDSGVQANVLDGQGESPAFRAQSVAAVQLLAARGADMNLVDLRGSVAAAEIVRSYFERAEVLKAMIVAGARIDGVDAGGSGMDFLQMAISKSFLKTARVLIEARINVNRMNASGQSAIFLAKSPEAIQLLAQAGADLNMKDLKGVRPLGYVQTQIYVYQKQLDDAHASGNQNQINQAEQRVRPLLEYQQGLAKALRDAGAIE